MGQVACKGFRVSVAKGLGSRVSAAKHATRCGHNSHNRCHGALVIMLRLWDNSVKAAVAIVWKFCCSFEELLWFSGSKTVVEDAQ